MPARIFPFFSHPAFGLLAGSPCRKGVSAGIAAACAQREQRGVGEVSPSTDNSSGAAQGPPQAPSSPLSPSLARSKQPNPLPPRWPRVTPAARGFPCSAGGHAQSHQHLPIPLCPPPLCSHSGSKRLLRPQEGRREVGRNYFARVQLAPCPWHESAPRREAAPRRQHPALPQLLALLERPSVFQQGRDSAGSCSGVTNVWERKKKKSRKKKLISTSSCLQG